MNDETETKQTEESTPAGAGAPLANAIGARNLMIIIVTMPLVFLVVVMATISILGDPKERRGEDTALEAVRSTPLESSLEALEQPSYAGLSGATPATRASARSIDPSPLVIPSGAEIGALDLDGDRLVVRVTGEESDEIVVYDLTRGAMVSRIRIVEGLSAAEGEL